MKINYVLQSKISAPELEQIAYQWLAQGDYTPDDVLEKSRAEIKMLAAPLYFFKHEYSGFCSAYLGQMVPEQYDKWDDFNKKYVRHIRYVTNWQPHSQPVRGQTEIAVYVGEDISKDMISFIEEMGWTTSELSPLSGNENYYGNLINLFQYSKDAVWDNIAFPKAKKAAYHTTHNSLPSALVRNLQVNVDFNELTSFSLVASYWVFNYIYRDKKYFVIVDGNKAERIGGIRPINGMRKDGVRSIRWLGWITGVGLLLKIYQDSYETIFDSWQSFLGAAITVFFVLSFTYIIVEGTVGRIKKNSKRKREKALTAKLNQLAKLA